MGTETVFNCDRCGHQKRAAAHHANLLRHERFRVTIEGVQSGHSRGGDTEVEVCGTCRKELLAMVGRSGS